MLGESLHKALRGRDHPVAKTRPAPSTLILIRRLPLSKIKNHFQKHKTLYVAVGTGLLFAGFTVLIMRGKFSPHIENSNSIFAQSSNSILGKNVVTNNVSYISSNRQGPPSWVVRCLETDQIFTSQNTAAEVMNLSKKVLSQHLNGTSDHVGGYHFERICMAA